MKLHGPKTTFGDVSVYVRVKTLDYHVIAHCDLCNRDLTTILVSRYIAKRGDMLDRTRERVEAVARTHRHALSAMGVKG
jgi:uncharacterized protein YuzB (UPF0349 family)